MTNGQIWALAIFAVIVLMLALGLWPTPRRLDGAQKYRRLRRPGPDADPNATPKHAMSPIAIALSFLTGGAVAGESAASCDFSDDVDADGSGESGDGGDGGGE
jgi:hypothetical protein